MNTEFKFRPQFTLYHPEYDGLLFWSCETDSDNTDVYQFMWSDAMPLGYRHILLTMHHMHDMENDYTRLNFMVRAMLEWITTNGDYKGSILVPLNRTKGTSGKDKTIIDDLNFVKAIRAA